MDKLNLRPSALNKSSLITIGTKLTDGERCAVSVVNATIAACKRYLSNLRLIPANCCSGISVEYTLTKAYACRIIFRFYSQCSLGEIDRYAERIQRDMTAILCYYRSAAVMDLKLGKMERDLMRNVSTIQQDLNCPIINVDPSAWIVKLKGRSKAFGRE